MSKTKELKKKRSRGVCQERIVFVSFGSPLPCERLSFQFDPFHPSLQPGSRAHAARALWTQAALRWHVWRRFN